MTGLIAGGGGLLMMMMLMENSLLRLVTSHPVVGWVGGGGGCGQLPPREGFPEYKYIYSTHLFIFQKKTWDSDFTLSREEPAIYCMSGIIFRLEQSWPEAGR